MMEKQKKCRRPHGPVVQLRMFLFLIKKEKLRYEGRIDDERSRHAKTPHIFDARNAIDALLGNKEVAVKTTKVFGCSIKWSEKRNWIDKAKQDWAKEPVKLDTIDETGLKELVKNNSGKLRLINVWATWCGPCVSEFPDFVTINRMYRDRDFEFISVSADVMEKKIRFLIF